MTIKKTKEKRSIELRNLHTAEGSMHIEGYAAVFDSPVVLWKHEGKEYKETIARTAFDGTDMSDCCLKYNHSDSVPVLARVRGSSLKLSIDDKGLKFEADLFNTTAARDVYELIKQGGLDKCSFAFTVAEDNYDKISRLRTITKIDKLFDVSIVDIPAYNDTDVSARDYFKAEAEKVKSLENEILKKRLELALKLDLADFRTNSASSKKIQDVKQTNRS